MADPTQDDDGWSAAAPHVLRNYSMVADGERGAVIGPRGDVAWLCVPRWDSPSVFSALIGGGGVYAVTPTGAFVWGGAYEDRSMIWRSRWITHAGVVECREALAYPADPHTVILLRQIRAVQRDAQVSVVLRPRGDYDRTPLSELHREQAGWAGRVGALSMRWSGPERDWAEQVRVERDGEQLRLDLSLPEGEAFDLVLELSDRTLADAPPSADRLWADTESTWHQAVPTLDASLNARDTRRSYAVLRGLTSTSGGMVAAATTSLPERAEEGRNYDYRYAWIRDQCITGLACSLIGPDRMLVESAQFVAARLNEHGDRLAPAYCVDGGPVPEQYSCGLPGYPGGNDVIGNRAGDQFQLDIFGEALLLFAAAAEHDVADDGQWRAADLAAEAIARRWTEPDSGIWELAPRAWTHSRLSAVSGLRAISGQVPLASASGLERRDRWLGLAEQILSATTKHALHPSGRWQRAADDPGLDAALLWGGLRGTVSPEDPRHRLTFEAYLTELTRDGYAYRFRHDDRPLSKAEGSFLLCGFQVALAHHQIGQKLAARSWYEISRAAVGPPQLFSEEYGAVEHQMRGNLAQAFVHALHLETAFRLAADRD